MLIVTAGCDSSVNYYDQKCGVLDVQLILKNSIITNDLLFKGFQELNIAGLTNRISHQYQIDDNLTLSLRPAASLLFTPLHTHAHHTFSSSCAGYCSLVTFTCMTFRIHVYGAV